MWVTTTLTVVDSVKFNYGDGVKITFPMPSTSNTHTYLAPGVYTVCLTRYSHQLGSVAIDSCVNCMPITIAGPTTTIDLSTKEIVLSPNPVTNGFMQLVLPENYIKPTEIMDIQGKKYQITLNEFSTGHFLII